MAVASAGVRAPTMAVTPLGQHPADGQRAQGQPGIGGDAAKLTAQLAEPLAPQGLANRRALY
jgi:hypothetical protein